MRWDTSELRHALSAQGHNFQFPIAVVRAIVVMRIAVVEADPDKDSKEADGLHSSDSEEGDEWDGEE